MKNKNMNDIKKSFESIEKEPEGKKKEGPSKVVWAVFIFIWLIIIVFGGFMLMLNLKSQNDVPSENYTVSDEKNSDTIDGGGIVGNNEADKGLVEVGHNENSVVISEGQSIAIRLDCNKSAGYSWRLIDGYDENVIKLDRDEYDFDEKKPENGGIENIIFKSVGKGQTTLFLGYNKNWESGSSPQEERTVQVIVE